MSNEDRIKEILARAKVKEEIQRTKDREAKESAITSAQKQNEIDNRWLPLRGYLHEYVRTLNDQLPQQLKLSVRNVSERHTGVIDSLELAINEPNPSLSSPPKCNVQVHGDGRILVRMESVLPQMSPKQCQLEVFTATRVDLERVVLDFLDINT